jgi:hypothetical protein
MTDTDNEELIDSPFKIYEEKYCNRCMDYRGCLGLIDNMSRELLDNKKSGSQSIDNMMKGMGSMAFVSRFKLILDCKDMREYLERQNSR